MVSMIDGRQSDAVTVYDGRPAGGTHVCRTWVIELAPRGHSGVLMMPAKATVRRLTPPTYNGYGAPGWAFQLSSATS